MNTHDKIELPKPTWLLDDDRVVWHPDVLAPTARANKQPLYTENDLRAAIEADRQRRGEPVAEGWQFVPKEPTPEMLAAFHSGFKNELHKNDRRRTMSAEEAGLRAMLNAAPQPAEPGRGEPVAEVVRDTCGGYSYIKWKTGYKAEVGDKLYLAPQPAEPVKGALRDFLDAAKEAGIDSLDLAHIYAEPVKVPSDAELEKAWDSFEAEMARHPTDDELEECMAQFADEMGHIHDDQHAEAARALLARYGQPSEPEKDAAGYTLGPISDGGMDPRNEQSEQVNVPSDDVLADAAGLGIREWRCDACGAIHDRDVNAALNILAAGRGRLAGET